MLRVSTKPDDGGATLKVEGKLTGLRVEKFRRCWTAVWESCKGQPLSVELADLTIIDASGKQLLISTRRSGIKLIGCGLKVRSVIEEITRTAARDRDSTDQVQAGVLKGFLFAIVLLFLSVPNLRAQESTALKLTLRDAVQLALRQNPQVQIANLDLAQSEEDRLVGRAALMPQIGIRASEAVRRFNLEAFIGRRFPGSGQHAGPFQTFQAGPGFTMPLFDLTLWRRLEAARHGVNATAAEELGVREQIVLLVVSQYLGGLRAAADVRAAQSRVDLAQALYDQAADLQRHGVSTGLDTLRANVQLQNEKQRLIFSQTEVRTSLYALARLLNVDSSQPLELTDEVSFFETPEIEAAQSIEEAYRARPEMKALNAREQKVRAERKAAGDQRLPRILLDGNWGYQGLSLPNSIPAYTFQATLDVPLFTGGRIRAETTKADLELRKVAREREELRNRIALEVNTGLAQLAAAEHEVEVAKLGVKLAEEEVGQARERFQAGVASNMEVISAQDALARANDNQIGALYRYNQSRADLAHATGQIESLYAK